jgi:hypothetical protein
MALFLRKSLPSFISELFVIFLILTKPSSSLTLHDEIARDNEDEKYWNRFLLNDGDTSSLTLSPSSSPNKNSNVVSAPTLAPITPSPVTKPTTLEPQPQPSTTQPTQSPKIPCTVEVTLDCRTVNGGFPCKDFPTSPSKECDTTKDLAELSFRYTNDVCSSSSNQQGDKTFCSDFDPLLESVKIDCYSDLQLGLFVTPPTVGFGDTFTVSTSSSNTLDEPLPSQVDCTILSANQIKLQQNVIDTSGNVPLSVGDKFGAFELVTCVSNKDEDCIENVEYTIEIRNTGAVPADITTVDFVFQDNNVENLAAELVDSSLEPAQVTNLEQQSEVNVCTGGEYVARVNTEATPLNGNICTADDTYDFTISSRPVPVPAPQPINVPVPIVLPVTNPPVDVPKETPVTPPPVEAPVSSPISIPDAAPIVPPIDTLKCVLSVSLVCTTANGTQSCDSLQSSDTGFADILFTIDITVPSDLDGTSVSLETLIALTNFLSGQLDLSSLISGRTVAPGGTEQITIPRTIDLTVRKVYTMLVTSTAETNPGGDICSGTAFTSFVAGKPSPPGVPTAIPTRQPTVRRAP